MKVLSLLPLVDWLALAAFFALWIGYAWFARFWGIRQRSLASTTDRYRVYWMREAAARDPRMLDGLINQALSQTPSFFSSASILVIGGLFALLGTADKATEIVSEIPFAQATSILCFRVQDPGADRHFRVRVLPLFLVHAAIHHRGAGDRRHAAAGRLRCRANSICAPTPIAPPKW
jgi:hypothetical protein